MEKLRRLLLSNRWLAAAAIVVIFLVAISIAWTAQREPQEKPPTVRQFFYDEVTGEEFVRESTDLAPLANNAGQETIVQAVYMSCDGGKTKKLMYLLKYTPEAKAAMKKVQANSRVRLSEEEYIAMTKGTLYRLPEKNAPWTPEDEAAAIVSRSIPCTGGTRPIIVKP